jgi:hypothetical protein
VHKGDLKTARLKTARIRLELPAHLRVLAGVSREIELDVETPVSQWTTREALDVFYPMLRGTIWDHTTKLRRPFLRFFASEQDLSHLPVDQPLPDAIVRGEEPFLVIGAIAGG